MLKAGERIPPPPGLHHGFAYTGLPFVLPPDNPFSGKQNLNKPSDQASQHYLFALSAGFPILYLFFSIDAAELLAKTVVMLLS